MTIARGRYTYLPDIAVAAVIAAVLVGTALHGAGPGAALYGTVLVGAAGMAGCRRFPVAGLAVTTVSMLGYIVLDEPRPAAAFGVLGCVFLAVRAGHHTIAIVVSALFLGLFLTIDLSGASGGPARPILERTSLLTGWFVAANVLGIVSRSRQAYLRQVEQRAEEAERSREEAALRRAGEERLRIARELHDSLTHSISTIKLQAGVALHLARKRGDPEPEAVVAIEEASGEAMRELRATLEVLRHTDGDGPGNGLDRIGELAERARSAGLDVTVDVGGRQRPLPAPVERAAYRIVQEALTNVTRHSAASSAAVRLDYGSDTLTVRVDDDGGEPSGTEPVAGVGLTGMAERVSALGGTLRAEPLPGAGFLVSADIPLEQ